MTQILAHLSQRLLVRETPLDIRTQPLLSKRPTQTVDPIGGVDSKGLLLPYPSIAPASGASSRSHDHRAFSSHATFRRSISDCGKFSIVRDRPHPPLDVNDPPVFQSRSAPTRRPTASDARRPALR